MSGCGVSIVCMFENEVLGRSAVGTEPDAAAYWSPCLEPGLVDPLRVRLKPLDPLERAAVEPWWMQMGVHPLTPVEDVQRWEESGEVWDPDPTLVAEWGDDAYWAEHPKTGCCADHHAIEFDAIESGATHPDEASIPGGVPPGAREPGVEAFVTIGSGVPELDRVPTGAELAAVLASVDPARVSAYDLVEVVARCEELTSWTAAVQARAIEELTRRMEMRSPHAVTDSQPLSAERVTGSEVGARLALTPRVADGLVTFGVELVRFLPKTLQALSEGKVDLRRASVIATETAGLEPEVIAAVEDAVLDEAGGMTPGRLRYAVRRLVAQLCPEVAEQRRAEARSRREVRFDSCRDGMAAMEAYLPAEDAMIVEQALDATARAARNAGDPRTLAQLRADTLVAWARGLTGSGPSAQVRVQVNVTVGFGTLLGLDELPAELAGYGPITAQAARELACEGTWRRLLTDPVSGAVIDYGRTRYRPPESLRERVRVRDRVCVFPGCDIPATRCDVDHTVPYPEGPTGEDNLGALCRGSHRIKHETGWSVVQTESGHFTWTSPTGHTYRVEPEPAPGVPEPPPF